MTWLILILYALATFRIAELLVIDDGPWDVFMHLRSWFYNSPNSLSRNIGVILNCVHCAGIWIAFIFAFTLPYQSIIEFLIDFLAIAGLQSVLANKLGRTS